MSAPYIGTDAVGELLGAEEAGWFDDRALALHPLGLDRVETWTLDRETADEEAHAMAVVLDLPVVDADPRTHLRADMPAGVVPNQPSDRHAQRLQLGAAPVQGTAS